MAVGNATVTVTADDGNEGTVQDEFAVIVTVTTVTSLEGDGNEIPTMFSLLQNYPNPFGRRTTIPFVLPQASRVTVSIYNSDGRKVEELKMGELPVGRFEAHLDAIGLSSGIYLYRFESSGFKDSKLMILQK